MIIFLLELRREFQLLTMRCLVIVQLIYMSKIGHASWQPSLLGDVRWNHGEAMLDEHILHVLENMNWIQHQKEWLFGLHRMGYTEQHPIFSRIKT